MVMLTLDCSDYTVAIFNQLFEKFACPLQLHFITLESLPEVRTVQIAIAKLQRRVPHLLNNWGGFTQQKQWMCCREPRSRRSTIARCPLLLSWGDSTRSSARRKARCPREAAAAAARRCSHVGGGEEYTASIRVSFPRSSNCNSAGSCSSLLLFPCCRRVSGRAARIPLDASHSEIFITLTNPLLSFT